MPGPSSSPGSPGVSGAIKDALAAIAQAVGPKAITQRKPKIDQAVSDADGSHSDDYLSRARTGQSSDSSNSYSE